MTVRRFVLGPEQRRERVDKLVARLLGDTSRGNVQRWIEEGRVLVDGAPCRVSDAVKAGATIDVEPGPAPLSHAEPDQTIALDVRYEDEHLLVVNKPAGLVVHPARGHATGTMVNGLLARPGFRAPSNDPRDEQASVRPGIVHRIDKDTSGLLVVAKDDRTREGLKEQLSAHTVERAYLALTLGKPSDGVIRSLHARDPRSRLRFTSRLETGRTAVTHVRVLEALVQGRAAFVECRLETGRTHQIRVHLAEQTKTPLLADALYGRSSDTSEIAAIAAALGRQALHAAVLGFIHPMSGEALRFEAELPDDFATALEQLRRLTSVSP